MTKHLVRQALGALFAATLSMGAAQAAQDIVVTPNNTTPGDWGKVQVLGCDDCTQTATVDQIVVTGRNLTADINQIAATADDTSCVVLSYLPHKSRSYPNLAVKGEIGVSVNGGDTVAAAASSGYTTIEAKVISIKNNSAYNSTLIAENPEGPADHALRLQGNSIRVANAAADGTAIEVRDGGVVELNASNAMIIEADKLSVTKGTLRIVGNPDMTVIRVSEILLKEGARLEVVGAKIEGAAIVNHKEATALFENVVFDGSAMANSGAVTMSGETVFQGNVTRDILNVGTILVKNGTFTAPAGIKGTGTVRVMNALAEYPRH